MLRSILLITCWFFVSAATLAGNFPQPSELDSAVRFWTNIYSKVSTNEGYLHDEVDLSVVYETLALPQYASQSERSRIVKHAQWRVEKALRNLASGKRGNLDATEQRVLAAWPKNTSASTFRQAANTVRFQLGQSDRFKEGLIRSGQWRPHIRRVLAAYNLPQELEVLPHVESSFNPNAYSKVAAAGMWQFMPGTARQYMRVDDILDERMDPFIATEGAAKLLKRNHEITGTWPLALTSYNHGAGGMVRASKAMGTKDIGVIVKKYKGPAFGFASRNFYACFLAALEVDRNAERYFGPVQLTTPMDYDIFPVHDYIPVKAIAEASGVSLDELKAHNPALRDRVWAGEKYIPRGYGVRIPKARLTNPLETVIAAIPPSLRFGFQKPDVLHRIAPGESLSAIASRYGTSVSTLMALNGLKSAHRIRAGQALKLPGSAQVSPASAAPVAVASAAAPQTSTKVASSQAGTYVVRPGDSLWGISKRFNVSHGQLAAWNGLGSKSHLKPGQTLRIGGDGGGGSSGGASRKYVIKPGDSLWGIAKRFNVSQQQLLAWNGLKRGQVIKPGQVLLLGN